MSVSDVAINRGRDRKPGMTAMGRNTIQAAQSRTSSWEPPALALLRCVVGHGGDGVTRRGLADEGWPTRSVSGPLNALRSRGYVVLESNTGHWIATEAGRRRAGETGPAQHRR